MALTDAAGEAPNQSIRSYNDITLSNLYVSVLDDLGNFHCFVEVAGEGIRVKASDCYFTDGNNWQGIFRIMLPNIKFYFTHNVVFNLQNGTPGSPDPWTRIMFGAASAAPDTVIYQHNTVWGHNGELYGIKGEPDYLLIDHNTFVATGQIPTTMEIFRQATFSNNLYHNTQASGDPINPARAFSRQKNEGQVDMPLATFMIDTLAGAGVSSSDLDSLLAAAGIPYQTVNYHHNNVYVSPELFNFLDAIDDTIALPYYPTNDRVLDMSAKDDEFPGIHYDEATITQLDPGFTNDPTDLNKLIGWASWILLDTEPMNFRLDREFYDFPWPVLGPEGILDFTYSNAALKTANGLHLGDLYHWYPDEYNTWITGVEENITDGVPSEYSLSQNYPNPFNPTTNIEFSIPNSGMVSVKVFNVLGQEVANLVNQELKAGVHKVDFDATNLTSGIYFYTLESGNFTQSQKMLLLK
jgi:hypothetical protein